MGTHRVAVGGPQQSALLAVLLTNAPRLVPLNHLIDAVWDEDPPDNARRLVQNSVSALRRAFADAGALRPVLLGESGGYRIVPDDGALDAAVFTGLVAAAGRDAEAGDVDSAVTRLTTALGLWRGPALLGLTGRIVSATAARLDEQRLAAAESRFDLELGRGRHHASAL